MDFVLPTHFRIRFVLRRHDFLFFMLGITSDILWNVYTANVSFQEFFLE